MTKHAIIFYFATIVAAAARAQAPEQPRVDRLHSALGNIVPSNAKVEKLADSPGLGTREGPVWIRKGGYLLYSDMGAKAINKWNPVDGKVTTFLENTGSNGVTLDHQGRIVWAAPGQVVRLEKDGKRTNLASEYQGKPLNTPNDLVYKSDGTLYFTDPGRVLVDKDQKVVLPDPPSVYMVRGGNLQLVTKDMGRPNGLAFSPDEKYLYINDTFKMTILRFKVQPDDTIADSQVVIDMNSSEAPCPYPCSSGYPDGMKVDQKGNLYCTGPGGVWIISPEGKHLGTILGLSPPKNLTFGGPDGKTLFITSGPGLYRIHLKIPGVMPRGEEPGG